MTSAPPADSTPIAATGRRVSFFRLLAGFDIPSDATAWSGAPGRWLRRALIATLLSGFVMMGTNGGLGTAEVPHGVLNLQLSTSVGETRRVLGHWGDQCLRSEEACASDDEKRVEARAADRRLGIARWALLLDFPFLLAYSVLLALWCARLAVRSGWPTAWHRYAARGVLLAGLADASEDFAHLLLLAAGPENVNDTVFWWGAASTWIKWTLISFVALFIAAAAVRRWR